MTFAPKNYMPLDCLWVEAYNEAHDYASSYLLETAKSPFHFMMNRTEDVCYSWFEEFYFNNLFLSDKNMNPIRVNGWVLRESRWYVDLSESEGNQSREVPDEICEKFSMCKPLQRDELNHFNKLIEEGDISKIDNWWEGYKWKIIEEMNQTRPPLFINQIDFSIDLSLFDFWQDKTTGRESYYGLDVKIKAENFRKFSGCHLCVPTEVFKSDWKSHWNNILDRKLKEHKEFELEMGLGPKFKYEGGLGRPRKQEAALSAYESKFPNGRQGRPWKEVIRVVEDAAGFKVSVDTLKRAIKNSEQN